MLWRRIKSVKRRIGSGERHVAILFIANVVREVLFHEVTFKQGDMEKEH